MSDAPHLDGQYGRLLLVEDVPGVQHPVLPRCEEHGGPGGAPAAVSQVLRVRAEDSEGQEMIIMSVPAPGPHDGALLDVLAPDPRTPVSNSQEILEDRNVIF